MSLKYSDLVKRISEMSREANRVRKAEVKSIVKDIRRQILEYGLTASDLGLDGRQSPAPKGPSSAIKSKVRRTAKGKKSTFSVRKPVAAKYRDSVGNTWTGRGKQPRWVVEALSKGKSLDSFLIVAREGEGV